MFSQFRMVRSSMKGEYDLEITNVTEWVDGFYDCQVTSSKNNNIIEKTKPVYLEVLKLPEDYGIFDKQGYGKKHKNGDFIFAKEGVPIEEICFVSKTHSTPKIYWAITKSGTLDNIISWISDDIPDVHVIIDSDNDTLKQGDKVRLICNVNSKPEHSGKYTWYHNNELLKKVTIKILYIEHLIPDEHNSHFTCRVNNVLKSGSNKIL
ncbi:Poly-glutamine tract binding protein 1 [Strongyloides ratti]|uniref:Poly-glutamine tract binding protein 1 n=1 Tax=Strongyloides ratti TaxID=34506 RepID=A0A090LSX1_STRRB|nr:Poly-glutamine tract binding protein 1 [Strongyloides ratti]CEF71302.1 Poly-glutamine tract binding protein 1 [Strongyloides ratti]